MKKLIEIIYNKYLLNGKEIPEDLLFEFSQDTIKIIQNKAAGDIPPEFWNFQHYVEMFWRGRKYEQGRNPALVYQMGQLLAYTGMLRDVADENEKVLSIEEYAGRWEDKYLVYKGIHDEPGINHKRLAAVSDLSVSSLSQFAAKTKWDGYFICRTAGREKYYYLTEEGERLYRLLNSRIKEKFDWNDYWANIAFNNTDYYYDDEYKEIGIEFFTIGRKARRLIMADMGSNSLDDRSREKTRLAFKERNKESLYAETGNELVRN